MRTLCWLADMLPREKGVIRTRRSRSNSKEVVGSRTHSCLWYSCHRGTVLVACILEANTVCRQSQAPQLLLHSVTAHTSSNTAKIKLQGSCNPQRSAYQVLHEGINPLQRGLTGVVCLQLSQTLTEGSHITLQEASERSDPDI